MKVLGGGREGGDEGKGAERCEEEMFHVEQWCEEKVWPEA